ncbi:hypothetical protein FOA52_008397 [Chlamydomonas sp. UWO 241]|nr:hypothetical protein FOA52_008397 [Chlamydomonas sp. UWO 241]
MPPALAGFVEARVGLRFIEYYEALHHNLALVPSLANPAYYDRKFTSTVITSLITGTPVIAEHRLLRAYRLLDTSVVFLQRRHESQMATMVRLLSMSPEDVAARRAALVALRDRLNARARAQVARWAVAAW